MLGNPERKMVRQLAICESRCNRLVFLEAYIDDIDENLFQEASKNISNKCAMFCSGRPLVNSGDIVSIIDQELLGRGMRYRVFISNNPSFQ